VPAAFGSALALALGSVETGVTLLCVALGSLAGAALAGALALAGLASLALGVAAGAAAGGSAGALLVAGAGPWVLEHARRAKSGPTRRNTGALLGLRILAASVELYSDRSDFAPRDGSAPRNSALRSRLPGRSCAGMCGRPHLGPRGSSGGLLTSVTRCVSSCALMGEHGSERPSMPRVGFESRNFQADGVLMGGAWASR